MDKIILETESVAGSQVDASKYWKPLSVTVHEVTPRKGFLGWLGRLFNIYRWAWVDRVVDENHSVPMTLRSFK